jgi:hypothetical protein
MRINFIYLNLYIFLFTTAINLFGMQKQNCNTTLETKLTSIYKIIDYKQMMNFLKTKISIELDETSVQEIKKLETTKDKNKIYKLNENLKEIILNNMNLDKKYTQNIQNIKKITKKKDHEDWNSNLIYLSLKIEKLNEQLNHLEECAPKIEQIYKLLENKNPIIQ